MPTTITKRLIIGLCCAVVLALLTAAVGQASSARQEPFPAKTLSTDCNACHENVVTVWEASAHGQATADGRFTQAWQEKGKPAECLSCHTTGFDPTTGTWTNEGIECAACHKMGPNSSSHPEQLMLTDASSQACGTCHVDTYAEWQASRHGQEEMTCVKCHNPHTTNLKVNDVQTLCQTCHNEESHFYAFTGHAQEGLLCTDCHLRVADTPPGEGHSQRVHTFAVDLNTCNECHNHQMHGPMPGSSLPTGMASMAAFSTESACTLDDGKTAAGDNSLTNSKATMSGEPKPASPFSFALLAAVIGMAFGIIGSPWLERLTQRDSLSYE